MNIKRFVAPDMRQALGEVRKHLGVDAVMLSSRSLSDGVEVIAAIDYDDSLFDSSDSGPVDEYARVAASVATTEPPEKNAIEVEVGRGTNTEAQFAARGLINTLAPEISGPVAAELSDIRSLLEHQLASLAWNDMNRRSPACGRSLRQLAKIGIDPEIAKQLVAELPVGKNVARDSWRVPLKLLSERLPLAKTELADLTGVLALIGPTGVGKTTTIAKIAARFVLRYGVDHLGLVSTDTYRIGAREQLMTFARILGTPMQVAGSAEQMADVLDGMRKKRLVLVDTAGMSQRDLSLAKQFATLRVHEHKVQTVLVLSATSDRGNLREAVKAFAPAAPKAIIATKLDETTTLGPILSVVINSKLPLAYLSDGQRVPEDLHLAGQKRQWLIQTAVRLAGEHAAEPDEADLAERFAGGALANG